MVDELNSSQLLSALSDRNDDQSITPSQHHSGRSPSGRSSRRHASSRALHHSDHSTDEDGDDEEDMIQSQEVATVEYNDDQRLALLKQHAQQQSSQQQPDDLTPSHATPESPKARMTRSRRAKKQHYHAEDKDGKSPNSTSAAEDSPQQAASLTRRVVGGSPGITSFAAALSVNRDSVVRAKPTVPAKTRLSLLAKAQQADLEVMQQQQQREQQHQHRINFSSPAIALRSPHQPATEQKDESPQPIAENSTVSMASPIVSEFPPYHAVSPQIQFACMAQTSDNGRGSSSQGQQADNMQVDSNVGVAMQPILGPPRVSAADVILHPEMMGQTRPHQHVILDAASSDAGEKSSSRRHKHRSHCHKDRSHRHGEHSSSSNSHKSNKHDKERQHKRKHSTDERKEESNKVQRTQQQHQPMTVRVKHEPGVPLPAAPPAAATINGRAAAPRRPATNSFFPEAEDDFFNMNGPHQPFARLHAQQPAASKPARTAMRRQEVSLRDKSKEHMRHQATLSKTLTSGMDVEMKQSDEAGQIDEYSVADGAGVRAKPELNLTIINHAGQAPVTPQRRRFADRLNLPDEDECMMPNDGSAGGSNRKGRNSKKGPLALALEHALATNDAQSRRHANMQLSHSASTVAQTGVASHLADSNIVRVLMCERHFGVRIALVSLAAPAGAIVPDGKLLPVGSHIPGFSSPVPVSVSQIQRLARNVAEVAQFGSSVPPMLLRYVLFPDFSTTSSHAPLTTSETQKLADFPRCMVRIRPPFLQLQAERTVPIITSVVSWERILSDQEITRFTASETQLWKKEGMTEKERERRAREEDRIYREAESMAQRGNNKESNTASQFDMVDVDDVDAFVGVAAATAVAASIDAQTQPLPRAPCAVPSNASRPLPIDSKLWRHRYASYHPRNLRADHFHALISDREQDILPLSDLKPTTDVYSYTICGIVQKVNWRGVNIAPNDEQLAAMMKDRDLLSPSFFIQDSTGAIVEIEVPIAHVSQWREVLSGKGGWITMLFLATSSTNRLTSAARQSMHQTLLPSQFASRSPRAWSILAVTAESVFELRLVSTLTAPKSEPMVPARIPFARSSRVTPLAILAKLTSTAAARAFGRVDLMAKIMHINNHPPVTWQIYLTDESLRFDDETMPERPPTSSLVVELSQQVHHRLFDVFFSVGDAICFQDVRVEFDSENGVPRLVSDEFTEIRRVLQRSDDAPPSSSQLYDFQPGARKVHPYTGQMMMIAQVSHARLHVDDYRPNLFNLLQMKGIASPLIQKHAIFGITGEITEAAEKPYVVPKCRVCNTLINSAQPIQYSSKISSYPFVCAHCSQANVLDGNLHFWTHQARIKIRIEHIDGENIFPLLIETSELQELFAASAIEDRNAAFASLPLFSKALSGRHLNATFIFSPTDEPPKSLDLRTPTRRPCCSFQVTSNVAHPTHEISAGGTGSQQPSHTPSQTGSQFVIDTPPEQVQLARPLTVF